MATDEPIPQEDLVDLLTAADRSWTGDDPSSPHYIQHLARCLIAGEALAYEPGLPQSGERPASPTELLKVQLASCQQDVVRLNAEVDRLTVPVADSELRDRVYREIDRHQYWHPGTCNCGWKIDDAGDADWSLQWKQHVADTTVATHFAPVLAERDQLRKQVQVLGNALQRSAYTDKDVAARDAEIERLESNEEFTDRALHLVVGCCDPEKDEDCPGHVSKVYEAMRRGDKVPYCWAELSAALVERTNSLFAHRAEMERIRRNAERDARVVDGLRGERITLWEERDKAATALAAIKDWKWERPPNLLERIELVASELNIARRQCRAYRDLLGCIELYVNWRYVTKQLETVQKELWADAVEQWQPDGSDDPPPERGVDRWWRDDQPAFGVGSQPDSEHVHTSECEHKRVPVAEDADVCDDCGDYDSGTQYCPQRCSGVVVDQPGGGGS